MTAHDTAQDFTGYSADAFASTIPELPQPLSDQPPLMAALRAEHRQMARVITLFEQQLDEIEKGEVVDPHVVYELMYYMVSVPDRFHHPREDLIYKYAAERNGHIADNVDTLEREHDGMAKRSREVLALIEGWRKGSVNGAEVVSAGRGYIARSYEHMNEEELVVFPQIEELLTAEDWRELAAEDSLRPLADPVFGGRIDREFRNLARKLRRNLRRRAETNAVAEWVALESWMESFELLSMAADTGRAATEEHVRDAFREGREMLREMPLASLLLLPINNTRHSFGLAAELIELSRDTVGDLARVRQEGRDRVRLIRQSRED